MSARPRTDRTLLSLRALVLIAVSAQIAAGVGALTWWQTGSVVAGILASLPVFGATLSFLHVNVG